MTGYLGSKGQQNVWRRIVSLIPPHDVLIVPFAGHCAVARKIRPCRRLILVDADPDVCEWWLAGRLPENAELHCCDGIEFLRHWFGLTRIGRIDRPPRNSATRYRSTQPPKPEALAADCRGHAGGSRVAVYCDPPYLLETRTSEKRYRCEMTDRDHRRLLEVASQIAATPAAVIVSGYGSAMYDAAFSGWIRKSFTGMTRGGPRKEHVWLNREPTELHDYRWHRRDKREREKLRRREDTIRRKLAEMSPLDRQRFLAAVAAEFGDAAEPPDSAAKASGMESRRR